MTFFDRLRENLGYDPKTGIFTWLRTGSGRKSGPVGTVTITHDGYRYVRIGFEGRSWMASHLAIAIMEGRLPSPDVLVDHKDRDGTNNRWVNIRELTPSESNHNRRQMPSKSGHRFIGICRNGHFRVRINGSSKGTFKTLEEAIEERDRW